MMSDCGGKRALETGYPRGGTWADCGKSALEYVCRLSAELQRFSAQYTPVGDYLTPVDDACLTANFGLYERLMIL